MGVGILPSVCDGECGVVAECDAGVADGGDDVGGDSGRDGDLGTPRSV